MHEPAKLEEATYFLGRMQTCLEGGREFEFNLSAFLAAARSVLQYGCRDAKGKTGGQAWYDSYIAARPILAFFKDKRDISIHRQPIQPLVNIGVTVTDVVVLAESVLIELRDQEGNVVQRVPDTSPRPSPSGSAAADAGAASITYTYRFADWPRDDDVLQLCSQYLSELHAFVRDGQSAGFLSP